MFAHLSACHYNLLSYKQLFFYFETWSLHMTATVTIAPRDWLPLVGTESIEGQTVEVAVAITVALGIVKKNGFINI